MRSLWLFVSRIAAECADRGITMTYTYRIFSGQGLRFDVYEGTRRICIAHSEADAKMICEALNAMKVQS
jgi:hypothetical protein